MSPAHLKLVDLDTGEVLDDEIGVGVLKDRIASLEEALALAERDLRAKRRTISALERDRAAERESYERRDDLLDIFNEWRDACRHPRAKLTDLRFDAIRACLEISKPKPYTRADFSRAIAGARFDPFCTRRKNGTVERHDDCELIFRGGGAKLESFANKAPKDWVFTGEEFPPEVTKRPGNQVESEADKKRPGDAVNAPGHDTEGVNFDAV